MPEPREGRFEHCYLVGSCCMPECAYLRVREGESVVIAIRDIPNLLRALKDWSRAIRHAKKYGGVPATKLLKENSNA